MAGTPEGNYLGCPINVPSTVLFNNGKPAKLIKTTYDDGCVNQVKAQLATLSDMRKTLSTLAYQRDKDYSRKK